MFEKHCEEENTNSKLIFIGTGPLFNDLKRRINSSKYKERIILFGESNEPVKFYMAMDIFVFPSRYEGLPVTLIEAQVAGLPCLISDMITDEVVLTDLIQKISLENEELWKEKIKEVCSNKTLRKTEFNKFEKFDIHNNVKKIEKLYINMLGDNV